MRRPIYLDSFLFFFQLFDRPQSEDFFGLNHNMKKSNLDRSDLCIETQTNFNLNLKKKNLYTKLKILIIEDVLKERCTGKVYFKNFYLFFF